VDEQNNWNSLAATHVMGWWQDPDENEPKWWRRSSKAGDAVYLLDIHWFPTNNMEQAERLLAKMREHGWFSTGTDLSLDSGQEDWIWHLTHIRDVHNSHEGRGEMPLAITMACVKAAMSERGLRGSNL